MPTPCVDVIDATVNALESFGARPFRAEIACRRTQALRRAPVRGVADVVITPGTYVSVVASASENCEMQSARRGSGKSSTAGMYLRSVQKHGTHPIAETYAILRRIT